MNKVITINLGGIAYQLEEGGYDALRVYLESAAMRLRQNPDRDEILLDIERAIAERFRALLGSQKTVVETKEVAAVVAEMGPIEAESGEGATPGAAEPKPPPGASTYGAGGGERPPGQGGTPRRLYRIYEGAMISGVCNGLAAYLNIDPTLVRLAFALLTMLWGTGVLVYLVMAMVVPAARSPEEKSAASGAPWTAQEFIRRAKEGYYETMKGFPDRAARREWKRRFKREMRGWRMSFDREMRANADHVRTNWHNYWTEQAPFHPGLGFALPVLSLLQGAAAVLLICAVVSLLNTSRVFGLALPAKIPEWLAALLLFMAYGVLTSPLKAARRACYWGLGRPHWAWSSLFLLDAVIWLAVVAVLLCLAVHFFPELSEAVHGLPALAHQAATDIHAWWKGR
ncbi:MAG TPA: PspC domain-containing protein [Candidatus Saccharimonadales bacterium]|nr:PspC domain-containing protein [Candidatus Saccharimonadales bacterium]